MKPPDFIIIGAQKCGTSTFYQQMRKHPDIFLPRKKELNFFDDHYQLGLEWYLRFFAHPCRPNLNYCTGEASPFYFFHPLVPKRISEIFPGIKLILLLRNPVHRAYSQYQHMKRKGRLSLSFEHCIHLEEQVLSGRKEQFLNQENHSDLMYRRFSFLARSRYAEQLAEWYRCFHPQQLLILRSEDYFAAPPAILNTAFQFLGLESFDLSIRKEHVASDYPPMKDETRLKLREYFKPYNRMLYDITGRDFGWDNQT